MDHDRFAFNRGAIRPMECLAEGWRLVKQDYWLFLGITFVGFLIAELASPFLVGPAMCGIHICLLRRVNGQRVSFDMLFQGFNYFGQSLIATLIIFAPIFLVALLYYGVVFGGMIGFAVMADQQQQAGQQPNQNLPFFMLAWIIGWTFVLILFVTLYQALFVFVYPLIVDRELTGWQAIRVSVSAAFANPGGVLAIVLLEILLGTLGALACYVGAIFVMPISFAMATLAYRQVFPLLDPYEDMPLEEEPPAPRVTEDSTAVQSAEPRVTSVQEKPPEAPPAVAPPAP